MYTRTLKQRRGAMIFASASRLSTQLDNWELQQAQSDNRQNSARKHAQNVTVGFAATPPPNDKRP